MGEEVCVCVCVGGAAHGRCREGVRISVCVCVCVVSKTASTLTNCLVPSLVLVVVLVAPHPRAPLSLPKHLATRWFTPAVH